MKTIIMTSAAIAMLASASLADDFDRNTMTTTIETSSTVTEFAFDEDGLTGFETSVTTFAYDIGSIQSAVNGGFAYDFNTDELSLIAQYGVMTYASNLTVYGTAEVEYRTAQTDFSNGDVFVNPYAGVDYAFAEKASVFAEVGYSWNATDDWAEQGGYVEIGVPVYTDYNISITPSVVQTFDDGVETANFNLDVAYTF